ncbi:DUF305 domain-containing protein [Phycicoccus flavus]|uniref:DUF305 domain-containing protein n=1 Tax=Phycicoccus flavus TaxID=2502783 RepID=A0A8T6QZP5_9MICO|nr:DUF305 domain-containing protein [Phycicoccus flavus]NHA67147.1 DUF305 domain-containing protein [Phycicoccus flavus]
MRRLRPLTSPAVRRSALVVPALVVGLAGVLGGCTSGEALPATTASAGDVPVLQPGRPGEPNATLTGPAATPVTTPSGSATDVGFLEDMIAHHAQALVLVDAVDAFSDTQVGSLASRIRDEQEPEIQAMARTLEGWGEAVPPEATNPRLTDHADHAAMPGMATTAQLTELAQARGPEADRLFLRLMIAHHEGALAMVDGHAVHGTDARVGELADDIVATQSKQIGQMRQMLERLA